MNQQLERTQFLIDEQITTADISLFAYTYVAYEGGFDLTHYPFISDWIEECNAKMVLFRWRESAVALLNRYA